MLSKGALVEGFHCSLFVVLHMLSEELLVEVHEEPKTPVRAEMFFLGFILLFIIDILVPHPRKQARASWAGKLHEDRVDDVIGIRLPFARVAVPYPVVDLDAWSARHATGLSHGDGRIIYGVHAQAQHLACHTLSRPLPSAPVSAR